MNVFVKTDLGSSSIGPIISTKKGYSNIWAKVGIVAFGSSVGVSLCDRSDLTSLVVGSTAFAYSKYYYSRSITDSLLSGLLVGSSVYATRCVINPLFHFDNLYKKWGSVMFVFYLNYRFVSLLYKTNLVHLIKFYWSRYLISSKSDD